MYFPAPRMGPTPTSQGPSNLQVCPRPPPHPAQGSFLRTVLGRPSENPAEGSAGQGREATEIKKLPSVSPARLTRLPVPQPSAMQIIACTRLPAFGGGQPCPRQRPQRRVGTPVRPTPFIIFTVNGPLRLLFSTHPASLKLLKL